MIDTVNDDLFQFDIERPFIPPELNADYTKLLELSIRRCGYYTCRQSVFQRPGAGAIK